MIDYAELVQNVLNGDESPLKAYAILSLLQKDIDKAVKEIKEYALEEANKYPDKTFEDYGFKFERRNGSARYSFKHIEEWSNLKEQLSDVEQRAKQAYSSYKSGLTSVSEDGEVMELPEVTYGSDVLVVK